MMVRFLAGRDPLPAQYLAALDAGEAAHVLAVGEKANTATLYAVGADANDLQAYAVVGIDDEMTMVVYAAHAFTFSGKIMAQSMFGVAQVLGKPIRVHTEKVRAMAKMAGAESFLEILDADGVRQVVANG